MRVLLETLGQYLRACRRTVQSPLKHRLDSWTRRLRVHWNGWVQITAYQRGDIHSHALPTIYQVEPTNYCNLTCPMCPHDLMRRTVGFMTFDLFRKVIDQVKGHSMAIRLHNMGESLFHKTLPKFIEYAAASGLGTVLSTNAAALNERNCEKLMDAGLDQLLISFDGNTKATYEACREKSKYDRVLANIHRLLRLKAERHLTKPAVTISLIDMPATHAEVDAFKRTWEGRVDAIRIKAARNWDGTSDRINRMVAIPGVRGQDKPCLWLWTSMVVLWDGRVVPCCMDYDAKVVLGDVHKKSLKDIYNDEPMRELRRLHVEGRVSESPLCRGCSAPTSLNGSWLRLAAEAGRLTRLGTRAPATVQSTQPDRAASSGHVDALGGRTILN